MAVQALGIIGFAARLKAKPVQYVKICSLYGAGFYYIPGTDTCIKIGGCGARRSATSTPAVRYSVDGRRLQRPFRKSCRPGVPARASRSIPARRPNTAPCAYLHRGRLRPTAATVRRQTRTGYLWPDSRVHPAGRLHPRSTWSFYDFDAKHVWLFAPDWTSGAPTLGGGGTRCSPTPPSSATVCRPRSRSKTRETAAVTANIQPQHVHDGVASDANRTIAGHRR